LEARFLYGMAPLTLLLLIGLMAGDWIVAGSSAQKMLHDRMATTSNTVAESVPFFLETGQQLIQQLAQDSRLYTEPTSALPQVLSQDLRSVPFFRQLYLMDETGNGIAGYPLENYQSSYPPAEELRGIDLALSGVPIQNYTIDPVKGETTGQVSFIATVVDESNKTRRVLIGRSNLASNPFTKPVLDGIRSMAGEDGEGMLLDGSGRIMYHPNPARLMEQYTGKTSDTAIFYDEVAPDGTRRLVYYQPVRGHPWSVVLSVPARRAQQLALNIAIPLLGMILLLFVIAFLLLRVGLRTITTSLQTLGHETNRISSGQLDHALQVQGEDEIAQLSRSFERMRVSLKGRLDELNRLLVVSQGVASSLEVKEAVQPVLDAALSLSASSARAVLVPSIQPELGADQQGIPARYGLGPSSDLYSGLDDQILLLANRQEAPLVVMNPTRGRVLNIPAGTARPEALIALPLRHESLCYGALWLAYDRPHQFTEDEIRFLVTLAGQAALAAANSQLFQSAEIGRQRLAAILASTPDPVLVTDQQNRLLLSNPAAWQELGLSSDPLEGQPIDKITSNQQIIQLMMAPTGEKQSAEITLMENRVYLATACSVQSDGQPMGRVCVMRDITNLKHLETLKSEFVQTVSHDLRNPLTQMKGYSHMLELAGGLNDQQTIYMRKIMLSVEAMTHLVNNLLDLGRIEAGVDLQRQMVLVHDVVERVTGQLLPEATQKHILLTTDIPPQTIPLVEADLDLLHQALYNLVENAIKYTNNGGKVKVSVRSVPEGMLFEVCDNGIGIAPIDQPRLFDKFYRGAQRDARKTSGTGLGLAIVKSITERHGGRVWVESQLGKGSTFYMLIPLRQPRKKE
jgi:PAS domain S-box-containing protein